MHANFVLGNSEKSSVDSAEKSEWIIEIQLNIPLYNELLIPSSDQI